MEVGISVIMMSYLSDYKNSRKNPEEKFIRAVESFLLQSHSKKELIIISDGCEITNRIYHEKFSDKEIITLVRVEKQKNKWPGRLREIGRCLSNYEWVCYLDTDDMFHREHLSIINNEINNLEDNELVLMNEKKILPVLNDASDIYYTITGIKKEELGNFKANWTFSKEKYFFATWQIVHKNELSVKWSDSNTEGEDTDFINKICQSNSVKKFSGGYMICHHTFQGIKIWDI